MRARRLQRHIESSDDFSAVRERLMRHTARCPLCANWDDPHEDMTKVCVVCEDTGRIPVWYALPLWFDDLIEEPPYEAEDEDGVYALHDRFEPMIVTCPFCRGAGVGVGDYPCPVCYRGGTTSAWVSATLMMVRCPLCLGSGISSGGMPGAASACTVCRTTGEVPLLKAVQYHPELPWWEFFGPYASFEDCLYESELDFCLDHYDLRDEARPGRSWTGLDITFEDLSGLDLRNSDFNHTQFGKLGRSNLSRSNLDGVRIETAPGANFSRASMHNSSLVRAQLQEANFLHADLRDANLRLADLTSAKFDGAVLDNADMVGAVLAGATVARAASLENANLYDSMGLTPRQTAVCQRKGAVFVAPSSPNWRDEYEEDGDW